MAGPPFCAQALGGATSAALAASGPVPADGLDMWGALKAGAASPRTEVVHNINGENPGALLVGDLKLVKGYPNQAQRGFDGWSGPPEAADLGGRGDPGGQSKPTCKGDLCPCAAHPCLFNVTADPEERTDLASAMPDAVAALLTRYAELQRTEVTLEASGLCPETELPDGTVFNKGGQPDASDPDGCHANLASGHWRPWL